MGLRYFLNEEAKQKQIELRLPRSGDAGFDLPCLRDVVIPVKGLVAIRTGVHLSVPDGCVVLLRDRSSVAVRGGVTVAGVIDSSFRGEVKVLMYNFGETELFFKPGERIAQGLILKHEGPCAAEEVSSLEELGETERGEGGFGSTGR